MKNNNYKKSVKKLTAEQVKLLSEKHEELRERYLMYVVTGVPHDNSVENALFDVFEGDNDIQEQFPNIQENKDIINFCYISLNFSSPYELETVLEDDIVQLNLE